eukprot:403351956
MDVDSQPQKDQSIVRQVGDKVIRSQKDDTELDKYFDKKLIMVKTQPIQDTSPLKDVKELIVYKPQDYFLPYYERRIEQVLNPNNQSQINAGFQGIPQSQTLVSQLQNCQMNPSIYQQEQHIIKVTTKVPVQNQQTSNFKLQNQKPPGVLVDVEEPNMEILIDEEDMKDIINDDDLELDVDLEVLVTQPNQSNAIKTKDSSVVMSSNIPPKVKKVLNPKWDLKGLKICVTGNLEQLNRHEFEDFIINAKGTLWRYVSKDLNILVIGEKLMDNRDVKDSMKYKTAQKHKKIKIMTESEFEVWCRREFNDRSFSLASNKLKEDEESLTAKYNNYRQKKYENIRKFKEAQKAKATKQNVGEEIEVDLDQCESEATQKSSPKKLPKQSEVTSSFQFTLKLVNDELDQNAPTESTSNTTDGKTSISSDKPLNKQTREAVEIPASTKKENNSVSEEQKQLYRSTFMEQHAKTLKNLDKLQAQKRIEEHKQKLFEEKRYEDTKQILDERSTQLWSDKYTPTCISELVGNQREIEQFYDWLRDWEDVHLKGHKKELYTRCNNKYQDIPKQNAKACIISGPPGIGKSSTVRVVAKELGYLLIENNSSDNRQKKTIENLLKDSTTSSSINRFQTDQTGHLKRTIILMDEIDGMCFKDRGGMNALIKVISTTMIPIVCIANDGRARKLSNLLNSCYELRFNKPSSEDIMKRIRVLSQHEKFSIDPNALSRFFDQSGFDIRHILNMLQMHRTTSDKFLIGDENYWAAFGQSSSLMDIEYLAQAADFISLGDNINAQIRYHQDWSLIANLGIIGCIAPGVFSPGQKLQIIFPEWLMKNNIQKRINRMLRDVREVFCDQIFLERSSVLFEVIPLIYDMIVHHLKQEHIDYVTEAVNIIIDLGISMSIFREHIQSLLFDQKRLEDFDDLTPAVKSSFTKTYNTIFKNIVNESKKPVSNSLRSCALDSAKDVNFIRKNMDVADQDDYYDDSDKETPDKDKEEMNDLMKKAQCNTKKAAVSRPRAKKQANNGPSVTINQPPKECSTQYASSMGFNRNRNRR